jgi:hypothetical protein
MPSEDQTAVGRQGSPYTGKLSARPAGKPGDFLLVKESLRRSLPHRRLAALCQRAACVFEAWRNLSVRCGSSQNHLNPSWGAASRWSAPMPGKGRDGRNYAPCSSSAMSSGRLFLDRVARQHCPSPLRRQGHHKTLDHRIESKYHRTARCGLSGCLTLGVHFNHRTARCGLSGCLTLGVHFRRF